MAAQRSAHLKKDKEKEREVDSQTPQKKKKPAVMGLMDEDVGNGLQEVDKWKALEPGIS